MVCHVAKSASNFTRGKAKWIGEESLKGVDWMYHYFHSELIYLRSQWNICVVSPDWL